MIEYKWVRDYIRLVDENYIIEQLEKREHLFNDLGVKGWKLWKLESENGQHFLFIRDNNSKKNMSING